MAVSLRRAWNRRMAWLAVGLVVMVAAAIGSSQVATSGFRASARRLESHVAVMARLRADIAAYAVAGHLAIESAAPQDAAELAALGAQVRADFAAAARESDDGRARGLLGQAETVWADGSAEARAGQVARDRVMAVHTSLADASDRAVALIDEATVHQMAAIRATLDHSEAVRRLGLGSMILIGLLGLGLTLRLGRRLRVEVLRRVARLRDSADRLAEGDFALPIVDEQPDELGELASSFNSMATAIADSHRDLTSQANHDSLTGLANRKAFRARLESAMAQTDRRRGTQAITFVDLDDFKDVNDTLGHAAGDALLTRVAARIQDAVRPGDAVARLGGDEFAILIEDVTDSGAALAVAQRAVGALDAAFDLDGTVVRVGASAGVAAREDLDDPDEWMRRADMAMYLAKGRGKNRVERYDAVLDQAAADRAQLKADLRGATERGEIIVDYQPIADLATGTVVALEALVRWQHPTRGLLAPAMFVGLAEESGDIIAIGGHVLSTALAELRGWQERHHRDDLAVSVNVSVRQLDRPDFPDSVSAALRAAGARPRCLVLEVTESVVADPHGRAPAALAALRQLGVRVALDDFGTGYSSMSYLRSLPVDIVKIDRAFVSGDEAQRDGAALLEALVTVGQRLDLDIVPEGIENSDQLARLRALGCHRGQGYLLSRPVPPADIDHLLASDLALPEPQPLPLGA